MKKCHSLKRAQATKSGVWGLPKIKKVSQKQGLKLGPGSSDFFFISVCGYPHTNLARWEINPPVRGVMELLRGPY